jgi:hypothetical protein
VVAIENAREGCVRETYGALVATWQSHTARDPKIRAAMRTIATDETRHGDLGWAIAEWAQGRLPSAAQRRVAAGRLEAVHALEADTAPAVACMQQALGLPAPEPARTLLTECRKALWTQAGSRKTNCR